MYNRGGLMYCEKGGRMNLFEIKDICRANFNPYLMEALSHIPMPNSAQLLDIACGTGVSVCEIARTADCHITAMDMDAESLKALEDKLTGRLAGRIKTMHADLKSANLPAHSYDIVLAEGIFNVIGFNDGLSITSRWLKHGGHMIIHDEWRSNAEQMLCRRGFEVLFERRLDETAWGELYYSCLEKHIAKLSVQNPDDDDKALRKQLASVIAEIDWYKTTPSDFRSVYYVVRKTS
jgi:cyclopropane fatty-acyl-phospholipid synthase-like methyltransferase